MSLLAEGGERMGRPSSSFTAGPLAESTTAGAVSKEFIYFGSKRIARRDSSGVHYFFSDHLGSSNVVSNATGATIEEESDFYPFGGERVIVNSLSDQDYKFTSKERDNETDFDYFGARYYAFTLGRFTSVDPFNPITDIKDDQEGDDDEDDDEKAARRFKEYLGNPQNWNRYAYAFNNPHKYIDEDGKVPVLIVLVALRVAPIAIAVGARYGPQVLNTLRAAGPAVSQQLFRLGPAIRGGIVELARGSPATWRFVQAIDKFVNGNAISIKSLDISAKSYQNVSALMSKLNGYVNQLASYTGGSTPTGQITSQQITSRTLQVVLPRGNITGQQMNALAKIVQDAAKKGVNVEIYQLR